MAICLRRSFKSFRTFAFVNKTHQQTNFFDRKKSRAISPVVDKNASCEYFPIMDIDNCGRHQKAMTNIQEFPNNVTQWENLNFNSHQSKITPYSYDNLKLNYSKLKDNKIYCTVNVSQDRNENDLGKPDQNQLEYIHNTLVEDLPKLFTKNMNYSVYHPEMIFENNIRGTKSRGIFAYVKEMALIKIVGHIKYAYIQFKILKITTHPEDGTVRVRWRITGISNYKAFFLFIKPGSPKNSEPEGWYDGFSIFYVQSDGLIHKHIVDKMMPDSEEKIPSVKNRLAVKMALAAGFMIKDFANVSNELSFDDILEKYPNLPKVLHSSENLDFSSQKSHTTDTPIHITELTIKSAYDN